MKGDDGGLPRESFRFLRESRPVPVVAGSVRRESRLAACPEAGVFFAALFRRDVVGWGSFNWLQQLLNHVI